MARENDRQPAGSTCQRDEVVAYLDGELDAAASISFEKHTRACLACRDALAAQRRLGCLLDAAFDSTPAAELVLPKNFTEVVTAHAQTNMNGVRCSKERRRALLLCAGLATAAFALLGASMFDQTLAPLAPLTHGFGSLLLMLGRVVVDAGAGAAVLLRTVGGCVVDAPGAWQSLLAVALLAGATALLLWLIGGYHRTRVPD